MPFGVVSRVGLGWVYEMGGDRKRRRGSFLGEGVNVGHPIVTNGLCGVVILCRELWRRGSSQIILGFLLTPE